MRKEEKALVREFETEEHEAEYWDTHSPLDLVAEPKSQEVRVRGTKDRPITIRLDSGTRAKLNKLAADRRLGPSTLARLILVSAVERQSQTMLMTVDELGDVLDGILPPSVKDKGKALLKKTAIGEPENPAMLVIDASQQKEFEEFFMSFVRALFAVAGIRVIVPEKADCQKVKEKTGAQSQED